MGTTAKKKPKKPVVASAVGTPQPEPLEPCDKPHVAEATRAEDVDEACDDGVH